MTPRHLVFGLCLTAGFCYSQQSAKLQIVNAALHQFDGGPAMPGVPQYVSGETLFFSCQFAGYKAGAKDNVEMEWSYYANDDAGVLLVKPGSGKVEAELAPEDKDWKPKVRFQFELPNTAACRSCVLRLSVTDKVSSSAAAAEIRFSIRGKSVEPSDTLVVRNFRFLRSEEDGPGLASASYRPGDELWARFEITGFRYGKDNRIQTDYGLRLFRPSGKPLYEEPKAAGFDETSFYPKRFVEGILNLRLQGLTPGEYPLIVEVRDQAGGQKTEAKFTFRVE